MRKLGLRMFWQTIPKSYSELIEKLVCEQWYVFDELTLVKKKLTSMIIDLNVTTKTIILLRKII